MGVWFDSLNQKHGKAFRSVKVQAPVDARTTWDVIKWAKHYLDLTKPHMIGLHLHGKRENAHYHVVGVPKEGSAPDVHLRLDKTLSKPHPLRALKKKPFQAKLIDYNSMHFCYVVKPKEWLPQGRDMVLLSSFDDSQIDELVELSEEYFEATKDLVPALVRKLDYTAGEDPAEFHMRAMGAVLAYLHKEKKLPGPHTTHAVRSAVYARHSGLHKYICKKYL